MGPGRGMVLEVNKRSCLVITGDGQFLEVPKPQDGAEVGQEITFGRRSLHRFKATYLAVASLLVAVLAWWVFNAMLPKAVAYVALDINPSLELTINGNDEIIAARGVNEDGQKLLKQVNVLHEPLAKGMQKIIVGCIEHQYIKPDRDNLVLATVTDAKKSKQENQDIEKVSNCVYTSINKTINESGVKAELIVADTDIDILEKAHDTGVTPGRYLLQKEAQKNGIEITNQELREKRIRDLEEEKNFRAKELIPERVQTDSPDNLSRNGEEVQVNQTMLYAWKSQFNQQNYSFGQSGRSTTLSPEVVYVNKPHDEFNARGKLYVPLGNGYCTVYSQNQSQIDPNNFSYIPEKRVVSRSSDYNQRKTGAEQYAVIDQNDNNSKRANNFKRQSNPKDSNSVGLTHKQWLKQLQDSNNHNQGTFNNNRTEAVEQQSVVRDNDSPVVETMQNQEKARQLPNGYETHSQRLEQLQKASSHNQGTFNNNRTEVVEQQSVIRDNDSLVVETTQSQEKARQLSNDYETHSQRLEQLQKAGSHNQGTFNNNRTDAVEQHPKVRDNDSPVVERTQSQEKARQLPNGYETHSQRLE